MRQIAEINRRQQWHASEGVPLEQHSLYRKVDAILSSRSPGRILEIGCGSGRFLARLRQRGWDVSGVDIQPSSAEYVIQHDAQVPLPYGREFDVVLAVEVIEHFVDTDGFLVNCLKALKPGGLLVVTTPNLLFLGNRVVMLLGRRPFFAYADYHVRMFVWDDLRIKIERHFRIRHVGGSHLMLGSRAGPLYRPLAWLGDRLPKLAAHFIVVAEPR